MITTTKMLSLIACGGALVAPRLARADEAPGTDTYDASESHLRTGYGVSAIVGGGLTGFTDKTMRDNIPRNVGGLWDLRITIGSHTPLALELGYVGTAARIDALDGSKWGTLVGTTAEAALRYNMLPHHQWTPYALVGLGWQRYDITGGSFRSADTGMNESDNSIVFPMGAGVAFRDPTGLVVDLHGMFRLNSDYGLVLDRPGSSNYVPMHAWEASGAVGYEF